MKLAEQVLDECISSGKGSKYKTWKEFKSEYNAKHFAIRFPELVCKKALSAKQAEHREENAKVMSALIKLERAINKLEKRLLAKSEEEKCLNE